jgi:hypothetical protein
MLNFTDVFSKLRIVAMFVFMKIKYNPHQFDDSALNDTCVLFTPEVRTTIASVIDGRKLDGTEVEWSLVS